MNRTFDNVPVYIVGDIHGLFDAFLDITEDLKDCVVIAVGDIGVGFSHEGGAPLRLMNDYFAARNIHCFMVRGNHDNPSFFKGDYILSHLALVPDYTQISLNGESFLLVGGAVSVDRIFRRPGRSWWIDETFVLDESLAQKCDVLVTHSAPEWVGPSGKQGIASHCARDKTLWRDCVDERKAHTRLVELCQPKKAYCGHFHISATHEKDGCTYRILDELEIVQHISTRP